MRLGRHLSALAATGLAGICGVWLMVGPWTLGYPQPAGAWGSAVLLDFWTGLGVVLVASVTLIVYSGALAGALRAAGLIEERPRPRPVLEEGAAANGLAEAPAAAAEPDTNGTPRAPQAVRPAGATAAAGGVNLDEMLVPIATALLSDLVARRAVPPAPERSAGGEGA